MARDIKRRLFIVCVATPLLYGCENWVLTNAHKRKINKFWYGKIRSTLGISWQRMRDERITNEACAQMLERMAPIEMSLEIELGVTGGEEDGVGHDIEEGADNSHLYTQPADVLQAYDRLSPIGHFSIAASFGNVHGVYKPGNVKLRPEILRNSQALVASERGTDRNPLHLVFHGGSGSDPEKIAEAVGYGVFKMNIDTDTQWAFASAVGAYVFGNERAIRYQLDPDDGTPYKKKYDPRKWLRKGEEGMVARMHRAFEDLGSTGRTAAG